MNNLIFIVFDSARYDHTKNAKAPWLNRLGQLERRFSYASWTSPSHFTYLMGQLPHFSPTKVFASKTYETELLLWKDRLGLKDLSFKKFLPHLSLPRVLKLYGYKTHAMVSMPVLNADTPFSLFFDTYELMPSHNDFGTMIEKMSFDTETPSFYFLNVGETHYPYNIGKPNELPHIHGMHGTIRHLDDFSTSDVHKNVFFELSQLKEMKQKQIACIEHLDNCLEKLYTKCTANTHIIITSDHGELFGEEGYFGHGPIMHEKVFEIPFIEGLVPH